VRACFSQNKQRQQMWKAAATGGSSRQDSKQACMRAEMRSYPGVCACVHAVTVLEREFVRLSQLTARD